MMLEPLQTPIFQRGLLEVLVLSIPAGILGSWIVLRGLAFYSHAVGTAAFPGLVVAGGLGASPALGALGAAAAFGATIQWLGGRRGIGTDAVTALGLAGFLAAGVILASDVLEAAPPTEQLLLGSPFLISTGEIALAGAAALAAAVAGLTLGSRWLTAGFDPDRAASLASASPLQGAALLGLIGLTAAAMLPAVGALLVAALLVLPAATGRLLANRMWSWQLTAVGLAAGQGSLGLWISAQLDLPPGPAIAVLGVAMLAVVALAGAMARGRPGRLAAAAAVAVLGLAAGSCGGGSAGDEGPGSGAAPSVVATTGPVGDLAANVAGDRAEVDRILDPGADPHGFEPRFSDVTDVADADLVLISGLSLDPWARSLVADSGSDAELLDLSDGLPHLAGAGDGGEGDGHEHDGHDHDGQDGQAGGDPHWWHDPRNAVAAVATIAASLAEADPAGADAYRRRGRAYAAAIRQVDAATEACLDRIPVRDRRLVTDHDAFSHLAARYDLEVVDTVIPALTTRAQASARDLSELIDAIERHQVGAIFTEQSVDEGIAATIAEQTGARADHALWADGLGPEGSGAETYLGMMAANARSLAAGLSDGENGCPERRR